MITFLTVVYVLVCIFLILVVLLQAGRGGGMGTAFGGSSQTVFGGAGAGNFLTRLTVVMAAAFMILSATLSFLSSSSDKALEKAAQAVKAREEARHVGPAAKGKKDAKAPAGNLTSSPTSAAGAAAPAAPIEEAPVEGAAPEGAAPEGAAPQPDSEGALKAVDDAMKAPAGAKPKPGVHVKLAAPTAPAEPAPAAPAPAAPAAP
jgi:preprotein translocase subunit SecG